MAITNASILTTPTVTLSGGTASTLTEISDAAGVKKVFIDNGSAFLDRTEVQFKVVTPKPSTTAPNGYTQLRNEMQIVAPFTPAGQNRTTNVIRFSISVDPSFSATDKRNLIKTFVGILMDADIDSFITNGALA